MTYPFGTYAVVVEVDAETGVWKVRRMVAVDDCGVRINPMIVAGQIHGGLAEGFAMSTMQWITFDEEGNCIGSNFMDYLIPTAWETPRFELRRDGDPVAPPSHRGQGSGGVGHGRVAGRIRERGDRRPGPPGVRNIDMPVLPEPGVVRHTGALFGFVRSRRSILEEAVDLQRRGEPFVLATVVWRRGPSSGQQGGKTIIRADGAMTGWVGGACAAPTVLREARAALDDGRPRLLLLGPAGELDGAFRPEISAFPMACESEGALELYLEPFLPAPGVVVVGRSPAVATLAELASVLGWRTATVDDADLSSLTIDAATAVVVATQGHFDEDALEAALASAAGYVGLVASRSRAEAVFAELRETRRGGGGPGPRARSRRARSGPRRPPGDRGRHPGRAGGPAGGRRTDGGGRGSCRADGGHRPGVRDGRRRRRRPPPPRPRRARRGTSVRPGASARLRPTPTSSARHGEWPTTKPTAQHRTRTRAPRSPRVTRPRTARTPTASKP